MPNASGSTSAVAMRPRLSRQGNRRQEHPFVFFVPFAVPLDRDDFTVQDRLARFALGPAFVGQRQGDSIPMLGHQYNRIRNRPVD